MSSYRTLPDDTRGMPKGIPYIIGNELAERFSFYGMKAILTVYMTKHLMDSSGEAAHMSEEDAKAVYHLFTAAAYFFPLVGALLSDIFLGKYRTILVLSMGYCVGHALLALGDSGAGAALMEPQTWLFAGLVFIAIGAGGIKPCVSAHVGDQFGSRNQHLVSKIFSWFYFSINVGAMASSLLTPVLLERVGPWAAFGLPGALMFLATFVFWLGRNRFVHIPAGGMKFVRETFSPEGQRAMLNLAPIFLIFIPMFWALFDQTGSAWVLQAASMDREFLGFTWLESQVQAVNPLLILVLIPVFAYGIYPMIDKVWTMTPLRKIGIGLFVTALAFSISGVIELAIGAGEGRAITNLVAAFPDLVDADMTLKAALISLDTAGIPAIQIAPSLDHMPNIGWQFLAYLVLTAAEVMVSITALEFAYTQAPKKMKSFIMGVFFAGVSIGNLFTAGVNYFIQNDAETIERTGQTVKLVGADYYWFFTILMAVFAAGFVVFARFYRGQTYFQSADDVEGQAETEAVGNV
jgi:POT family proton-dependent oligopeptide transporter